MTRNAPRRGACCKRLHHAYTQWEGAADRALETIAAALKDKQRDFIASKTPTAAIPDAAEAAADVLEAAEMVPMYVPPTAQIRFWREQPAERRDRDAIRGFAYDLGLTLNKYCLLYCVQKVGGLDRGNHSAGRSDSRTTSTLLLVQLRVLRMWSRS
ncbi:MAG: hypothetical protein J0H49_30545 [Acidobacteria bacterium]|nr:hypothetical protein [Acidobacteriota bacterium]